MSSSSNLGLFRVLLSSMSLIKSQFVMSPSSQTLKFFLRVLGFLFFPLGGGVGFGAGRGLLAIFSSFKALSERVEAVVGGT